MRPRESRAEVTVLNESFSANGKWIRNSSGGLESRRLVMTSPGIRWFWIFFRQKREKKLGIDSGERVVQKSDHTHTQHPNGNKKTSKAMGKGAGPVAGGAGAAGPKGTGRTLDGSVLASLLVRVRCNWLGWHTGISCLWVNFSSGRRRRKSGHVISRQ